MPNVSSRPVRLVKHFVDYGKDGNILNVEPGCYVTLSGGKVRIILTKTVKCRKCRDFNRSDESKRPFILQPSPTALSSVSVPLANAISTSTSEAITRTIRAATKIPENEITSPGPTPSTTTALCPAVPTPSTKLALNYRTSTTLIVSNSKTSVKRSN